MKTLLIFLSVIFLMFSKYAISQVTFEATVSNQIQNGTELSFDLYLHATGVGDMYLGNADFVFFYNSANFTAPTFEYEDGSSVFVNSNGTPTTSYNDNIVTDPTFLASGQFVINIQQPAFGNQTQFNSRIAKINATPGLHKLGTFTITGITNPSGTLGLGWKTIPPGVSSNVQTLTNTDPWFSSAAPGTYPPPFDQPLPVSISSFTADVDKNNVSIYWTTEWEENNDRFEVQRKINGTEDWSVAGSVTGNGTTQEQKSYSYLDRNLVTGMYDYRIISIDFDGNVMADNSPITQVEVGVPTNFDLSQNYPNPFNPVTKINYEIPVEAMVRLHIYDMAGRLVSTLVNETVIPGYYTVEFNGVNMASGVYFYRLVTDNNVMTKRMVLVK